MSKFKPKVYTKDYSYDPIFNQVNKKFVARSSVIPISTVVLGILILLTQVVYPLISFSTDDKVSKTAQDSALGFVSGFGDFEFSELNNENTVRPVPSITEFEKNKILGKSTFRGDEDPVYFYISIPKLGIKNAKVEINAPTLKPDNSLGHYTGSALPGEIGNTFIYGHSVLPYFFNPKNYRTIFSTLNNLEPEDEIYVSYKGKTLTYVVENKRQLKPEEVNPLATIKPKYLNDSTLVLMTCSPPGTKIYRLLVDTKLIKKE